MIRLRSEIWCLLGWTLAVAVMRIVDDSVVMSGSKWLDVILHLIFWAVGILALHLIFRAFRSHEIEQEKAREALRASEQHYRELFIHMSEGFSVHEMIYDRRGRPVDYRFVAVNPAFERLTGLTAAAVVGRTVREVIPGIETEWIERYGRVVETGEPIQFEQSAAELGKVFSVEAFRSAPGMFACTFTDITEQKRRERLVMESESRLRAILHSIDDLVFVLDRDGRFRDFAQDAGDKDLIKAPAEFRGRRYSEVLPPSVSDGLTAAIERICATGESQSFEYQLEIDGMSTHWSARISALRGEHDSIEGTVAVTRNVTLRRLDEQHLRQRNRYLEGMEKISTILLGGVEVADTFDRVASEVAAMTGYSSVLIAQARREPGGPDFAIVGMSGLRIVERERADFRFETSVTGRVIRDRVQVVMEGAEEIARAAHPVFRGEESTRLVAVPILRGNEALGSVLIADRSGEGIDPVLAPVLSGIANHIAIHLARIESERARQRNEVELLSIYDHAPVIMALLDESAEVIRSNRAAREFAGIRYEAGRKVRPGELLSCLGSLHHPNGCGHGVDCARCALRLAINDTLCTGAIHRQIEVQKEVVSQTGTRITDLLVSTAPLELDGQRRVLLVMEDVTKTRLAEDRLREQAALLDVTHDAIFVHDATGRIIYWNKGAEELYRVPRAEAIGHRVEEIITEKAQEAAASVVRGAGGVTEIEQTTRDGREIVVQSRRAEMRDASGVVRSILVVNTDITENHRLNRHLLRSQRLESIGTLASGIAHDLNNILAPIMMSIGLLRSQCDDTGKAVLETIETCVRRGGDIVRQVLLFARGVDGQRIVLQPRHVLNEVLRIMRETFPRSISITSDVCRDPWSINGDPTQIQQVLLNLCVNARDAMPRGGELRVAIANCTILPDAPRVHPRAEPGRYVQVDVSDNGSGIAPELLEQIFDPFFTTKPQGQGTGLGLATTLGIVEKHGGFILVDSVIGRGSKFSFFLPACDAAPVAVPAAELQAPRGDGARILVVDDEPAVRKLVQHMLVIAGYRVEVACDGQDCVDVVKADTEGFAVILTDLMMPRLDGGALIGTLLQMRPNSPVIAMTGVGEERRVHEAMSAGVKFVLNKPFEIGELLRLIHRVRSEAGQAVG